MRIDSHQHFWKYNAAEYPWMQPSWPIRGDFLPTDLEPLLRETGLEGTVAVQARQTLEETRWLLQLADEHPIIKGVVGWVDLRAPNVAGQLGNLRSHPKLVGVRHVVQDEPDDNFMLRTDFLNGIEQLADLNLTYDILVFPKQLHAAVELVKRFPKQRFVLDHIAKPNMRTGAIAPWNELIVQLASFPNVFCKVSGLVTEADWSAWTPKTFEPFLELVGKNFGPERLMFGSDWPVCLLAGSYLQVRNIVAQFVASWSHAEQKAFFGGNAASFYQLKP